MVGHMIDVTEGYLARWDLARQGQASDTAGLLVMADSLNQHAQAFRSLPRAESGQSTKIISRPSQRAG